MEQTTSEHDDFRREFLRNLASEPHQIRIVSLTPVPEEEHEHEKGYEQAEEYEEKLPRPSNPFSDVRQSASANSILSNAVFDQNQTSSGRTTPQPRYRALAALSELEPLTLYVPWRTQLPILLGPPVIILCGLVTPCLVYYTWLYRQPEDVQPKWDARILGAAGSPFFLGGFYILFVRIRRLIRYQNDCGPLRSRHWWSLDATSWLHLSALIAASIPFVLSITVSGTVDRKEKVIPKLYLCSPGIYVAFLWIVTLVTVLPTRLPATIEADGTGSWLKPIAYYVAEDLLAVDGWQCRGFRKRFAARYETSEMFRRMILELTLFWLFGSTAYLGGLAAIVWHVKFEYAFGAALAMLFGWTLSWAALTWAWVFYGLSRERQWWTALAD